MPDESNKPADDQRDHPVPTQADIDRFRRGVPPEDEPETLAPRKATPRKEQKPGEPKAGEPKDESDYSTREMTNQK